MGTYALTGSASGIGAALRSALAEEGHSLITVDIKEADIIADLTTPEGRQAAVKAILDKASDGLDGFVPLAGLGGGTAPDLMITRLNYFGAVELVEGLRPALAKKSGAIVFMCSNSAPMVEGDEAFIQSLLEGNEGKALQLAEKITAGTHYMQTKRALNYWMRHNIMAYGRDGIRMNAIAPGPTVTPMTKPLFESEDFAPVMQALIDDTPANRPAEAKEIVSCIQFLLSPAASNVYGTLLFADGGYDAHIRPDHV